MACFLTQGRLALLDALKNDAGLAAQVATWQEFGPGLRRRLALAPSACPMLSLAPAQGRVEQPANAQREISQALRIDLATDGQDSVPIEELAALVIDRVHACNQDAMGLASQGLRSVRLSDMAWRIQPMGDESRVLWTASLTVVLTWRRT